MSSSKYPLRRTVPDLVWLRGLGHERVLKVETWRSEPSDSDLCFFAPHFYRHDSPQPWLCGPVVDWPPEDAFEPHPKILNVEYPCRESFTAIHSEILRGIGESRFKKVVPFASQKIDFESPLSWAHWPRAFHAQDDQFAFGFNFGPQGMCGITPELLFYVRGDVLITAALAGTGVPGGPNLLDDRKEKLEHDLVTEHILSALADLGPATVGETRERNYPTIKHLFTPISVKLKDRPNFAGLVNRLHPTAALGGVPRTAALDFLRLRGGERGRFGAPFGFSMGPEMVCIVAIRALQWQGQQAWLMSGCGVVEGSQADREWNELGLKRQATALQLGLAL